ncbi:hypothetical protein ABTZ46_20210 [Nocardioides sp. NPDC126508]
MDFSAIATITQSETEDVLIEVLSTDDLPRAGSSNPVATITSAMRPGGPDPDPFVSPEHRITYLLREIGWAPTETVVIGTPFGVVRETRFRATVFSHEGSATDAVQVRNDDGEVLAELAVSSTATDALGLSGWTVLGAAGGGWPDDTIAIAPRDWKVVIEQAKADREMARREAARRDSFWAACVREAILDGHTAKDLAEIAGVSVQRIYQIRDRRR